MTYAKDSCLIPNNRIYLNDSWILIKNFVPFSGLGSFAKIVDKDPNCIIVCDGPIVSLRTIKSISFGEEITFVPYKTSTVSHVIIKWL